jgi:hypothetical protein
MRIISFDVGMKNLAYCLFQVPDTVVATATATATPAPPSELIHQIQIERWDVIDLRFPPTNLSDAPSIEPIQPPPKRTCINDGKLAKWMYIPGPPGPPGVTPLLYCSKCSEKSKYKTPSREILPIKRKPELLMKKKLGELVDIKANLSTPPNATAPAPENLKLRKSDLIQEITMTLSRDYLEPFEESKYSSYIAGAPPPAKPKKVNYTYAHDLDLITYGQNMMKHLDAILYAPSPSPSPQAIDMMIIENQISTLASRMKTLQGMITQYFIMKHIPHIEFISASCKLKLFTDVSLDVTAVTATATDADADADAMMSVDASTYADRKKSGIAVCRSLGKISRKHNSDYAKWMPVFENHKKKDDLADCFLQGLWRFHLLKIDR